MNIWSLNITFTVVFIHPVLYYNIDYIIAAISCDIMTIRMRNNYHNCACAVDCHLFPLDNYSDLLLVSHVYIVVITTVGILSCIIIIRKYYDSYL